MRQRCLPGRLVGIHATRDIAGPDHVEAAPQHEIAIDHDTDTIAAIAGALLGALWGLRPTGRPRPPGPRLARLRARDLVRLALAAATGGRKDSGPATGSMLRGDQQPLGATHPYDLDVILGTEANLARCAQLGITAVVSLSRVGEADIPGRRRPNRQPPGEGRLIDSDPS